MAAQDTFDAARFEELVLYIAQRVKDDPAFGRTKFAKVLYYSDSRAFRDRGVPVTGATYIRMPHGPFPVQLGAAEKALEAKGRARLVGGTDTYDPTRLVPSPVAAAAVTGLYESWALALVNEWIDRIEPFTAWEVSERSHEERGWKLAGRNGVEIPLHRARIARRMPTKEDFRRGKQLADEHGWP